MVFSGISFVKRPKSGDLPRWGSIIWDIEFHLYLLTRRKTGTYNRTVLATLSLPADATASDGRGMKVDAPGLSGSSSGCRAIGSEGSDAAPTAV